MATVAQCLYCFEVLVASFEKREPLKLRQVEELWAQYEARNEPSRSGVVSEESEGDAEDLDMADDEEEAPEEDEEVSDIQTRRPSTLRPSTIARLQGSSPASRSSSATPSTLSATSSQGLLGDTSKSSSKSSLFSFLPKSHLETEEEHPLFVTWNTVSQRGNKSLRGCIGTFEAQKLSAGLKYYALTSAFDDVRFSPISTSELSSLSVHINLLMNFTLCTNPLDWDLETHGIRISFTHHSKRFGSTYLPDVAMEQGWSKEETIVSLMRKAGWSGRSNDWKKVTDLKVVRYEGMKAHVGYSAWREWRTWVDKIPAGN